VPTPARAAISAMVAVDDMRHRVGCRQSHRIDK